MLQRRLAELAKREQAGRDDLDEAVRTAAEASGGRKGLLGRGGGKSVEELHNALRSKEAELQAQERRLSELNAALQRRESDLDTYARKLQRSAAADAASAAVRPSDFTVEEPEVRDAPYARRRRSDAQAAPVLVSVALLSVEGSARPLRIVSAA